MYSNHTLDSNTNEVQNEMERRSESKEHTLSLFEDCYLIIFFQFKVGVGRLEIQQVSNESIVHEFSILHIFFFLVFRLVQKNILLTLFPSHFRWHLKHFNGKIISLFLFSFFNRHICWLQFRLMCTFIRVGWKMLCNWV